MNFSSENTDLWSNIIQLAIISGGILLSNVLRRKVSFVRKGLVPTAVIAGFLFLFLKAAGVLEMNPVLLETICYHGIGLGFIALSLRIPSKIKDSDKAIGAKSGALIVSTYLLQGVVGILVIAVVNIFLEHDVFAASGLLLPMGYGQGTGQANNVGIMYEKIGFAGGQSFGLAIAATGYLCACVVGIIVLNVAAKKGRLKRSDYIEGTEDISSESFQDNGEIPVSESIDRFTIQMALVLMVYGLTYYMIYGITELLETISPGVAESLSSLFWGFNFIFGSLIAIIVRVVFTKFRKANLMTRQYQNNYLLSRISGFAFDLMIVAGIAAIDIKDLSGLWIPFFALAIVGGVITLIYLKIICKRIYPGYYYEGMLSMYGMLTGTISSGVLLLREIDPKLETPASNNLITGSSYAIMLGAPLLLIISLAPQSMFMLCLSVVIMAVYMVALIAIMYKLKLKK